MSNLNQLLKVLLDNELDFIIVGGFAAVLHGASIVTQDLDLCIAFSPATIEQLRHCLAPYHPVYRHPKKLSFIDYPQDCIALKNVYLMTDLGPLDLIGEITGVGSFAHLNQHAVVISLFGKPCKIIGLRDLITAKQALKRPKDLLVIEELERLHKESSVEK